MSDSISAAIFTFGRGVNRLLPVRFQFDKYNHQVSVHTNVSDDNINFLEQWLDDIVIAAGQDQRITQELCHVLDQAFNAVPIPNNHIGESNEKLAVMIIDGALTLGDDPLAASEEFNRRGITLAVVTTAITTFEVWNYYRTLAHYTGGGYMSFENAPDILDRVILSSYGEDTLRQAFRRIDIENSPVMANNSNDMNEQNQITDGVGELVFDHGLSE